MRQAIFTMGLGWLMAVLLVPAANSFRGRQFVGRRPPPSRQQQATTFRGRGSSVRGGSGRGGGCGVALKMMEEVECDVVIVGGGPAGCTCALYTSRADLKTVIVDKNPSVGALAITSHIANYPGVDKSMTGEELLDQMRKQAVDYGTEYHRLQVFLVDVEGESKYVYTPEKTFKARSLVLATGAMGRKPSFKGEGELLGRGVSYCATCDGAFYRDAEVAVVGVNQEAVDEAEFLTKFASTVHWITPSDPREEDENAQRLLAMPNVKHWSKTNMVEILGDESGVTGITLKSKADEEPQSLAVEGVFIYVAGSKPITDFLENKVQFNDDGGVWVDEEMATTADGVYAIGDIRNTPFKQVVVAASDGCVAAMAIDKYLKGRKNFKVDWIHK
jgi:thioredoxin reductase (NADPH)